MRIEMVSRLLNVPSTDLEDARRRKLLNILLLGIGVIALLSLLLTTLFIASGIWPVQPDVMLIFIAGLAIIMGNTIIFAINRYRSGWLASSLFLLILSVAFALGDEPHEVVDGRTTFMFVIPIIMASVLLRPWASFITAGLVGVLLAAIALGAQLVPNVIVTLGFFAVALVSWLSARSLEQALADVRVINQELDQRVKERTRDLAAALAREQTEASKNQAVLEGIADGVIVFDNQGQSIVANPAIADLIERPIEEITGHNIETLMGEQVDAADREMIANLLKDREAAAPSVRFKWGQKTLSVSVAPVRGASDQVIGTVAVFRDYTREAEVERMKSNFVSMVSHDLRTPLSAILGYTDMLRVGVYGPLSDKQADAMTRINANTGRLLNIVNNLLDQAQIEAGRLVLHVSAFDPHDLLADMEVVMGVLARNKGLELDCHVADDLPSTLSSDRQRLHQILVNLVNNGIKFTEDGRVSVSIRRHDLGHWALVVSDTGPGIPAEAQSYVFEPFRRIDSSITREHPGVGLGLAIVKQLTTRMGGEIALDSKEGCGTTFTIVFPFTPINEEAT